MNQTKRIIDGSHGEGGGQIFRTSLSLAMYTQQSVRIINIRNNRKKPGLLRQHLTCLNAAKEISSAQVCGDALGSTTVEFHPGSIRAGNYHFSIGSAGSTSLVLQTILPVLMTAPSPSMVTLEGGTHNPMAPSLSFLEHSFFPLLNKMGIQTHVSLKRYGFYPAGGGCWSIKIIPCQHLKPITIHERGAAVEHQATALVANLPESIAIRELEIAKKSLNIHKQNLNISKTSRSPSPGNVLSLIFKFDQITEVVTAFGERGMSAEKVAKKAVVEAQRYLHSSAPIGEHLADQLLIPMAMTGTGSIHTLKPSKHTLTNIEIIQQLMNVKIQTWELGPDLWEISLDNRL